MLPRTVLLASAVVFFSVIVVAAAKRKRGVAALGCLFVLVGVICLSDGMIIQRWHGGPPVEGSLATFGSLVILGIGIYAVFLALFRKRDNHTQGR